MIYQLKYSQLKIERDFKNITIMQNVRKFPSLFLAQSNYQGRTKKFQGAQEGRDLHCEGEDSGQWEDHLSGGGGDQGGQGGHADRDQRSSCVNRFETHKQIWIDSTFLGVHSLTFSADKYH